ncbi:tyrosine-type recombinase/integrase [Streptomyces lomondensis]|uniref:Tyr recombinase domain-containing protein n=1 Tax=Streptomyces lomondensis TaxID=68229 RepID=A0ABQ2XTJ5_9ACTN|nr:hypothetical protein [Streptomyces lomondensis]MCF0083140.1 hypothetical protein [Streptomyces lomondensis]GGX31381.1 hypothetical protein GCM10010383_72180 [Streptomyces lomondensis]
MTRFWQTGVRGAPGTVKRIDERVRLHIRPQLGTVALRDISPAVLRGYIAALEKECSPRYVRQILTTLSNIFETAIDDKRLARNPVRAKSVRWPKVPEDQREAWPLETAQRVRDAINARYRIAVVVALGCGLRQGEVFGLSPEDVDFARGVLRIRRQVQLLHGRLYFTLPKGGKTRVVDMPPSVAAALAQYFMEYPAVEVELPWGGPEPDRETKKYSASLCPSVLAFQLGRPLLSVIIGVPRRHHSGEALVRQHLRIAVDRPERSTAHSPQILPSGLRPVGHACDRSCTRSGQQLPRRLLRASPAA